jgi:hypothetical protein
MLRRIALASTASGIFLSLALAVTTAHAIPLSKRLPSATQPASLPAIAGGVSGIAYLAPNDVWALGCKYIGESCGSWTEHWDGNDWQEVAAPHPGDGAFNAVDAISSNDIYGVGVSLRGSVYGLIAHWDGSTWQQVGPAKVDDILSDVSAVSSNDVWAVGEDGEEPIAYHWDGSTWNESVLPWPGGHGSIAGVDAIAADNVWTVGRSLVGGNYQAFFDHWDGTSWTTIGLPVQWTGSTLSGIDAIAADDIWAVGFGFQAGHHGLKTLALHYDGTSWAKVRSPKVKPRQLSAVSGDAPNNVWAVGTNSGSGSPYSVVEHWNGKRWRVVQSPSPFVLLGGALALPSHVLWAWGANEVGGQSKAYLGQWDGTSWTLP